MPVQVREWNEKGTAAAVQCGPSDRFDGEPGFADASWPGQCEQPSRKQRLKPVDIVLATHEPRQC